MDVIAGIASRLRRLALALRGVRFQGSSWLRSIEVPRARGITLGDGVALDRGVTLLIVGSGRMRIGADTYVNRSTFIDASAEIEIGERCMIGPFCYITDHDHDLAAPQSGALVSSPTRIEAGAWIGAHVTVLKGVTIGAGAVVGAGSVVTKSIPSRCVAAGNPARILRELPA